MVCFLGVCVCVCLWVGGSAWGGWTTAEERERGKKKRETVRRCKFKKTNEGGKDFTEIGRAISAAAAAAACLPLTACSCEPVLGMTANGLPGTLAYHTHQCGLRYICKTVDRVILSPLYHYVDPYLIVNQCPTIIISLTVCFISRRWVNVQ